MSAFPITNVIQGNVPTSIPVQYIITITNNWNASTYMNYPEGMAELGPQVIVAHNEAYTLWREGGTTSPGLKELVEDGNETKIIDEFYTSALGEIGSYVIGPNLNLTESQTQDIKGLMLTGDFNRISMAAKLYPGLDFFSGFYDISPVKPFNETRLTTWFDSFTVAIYPFEAPEPLGANVTDGNARIHRADSTDFGGNTNVPIAYLNFTRTALTKDVDFFKTQGGIWAIVGICIVGASVLIGLMSLVKKMSKKTREGYQRV